MAASPSACNVYCTQRRNETPVLQFLPPCMAHWRGRRLVADYEPAPRQAVAGGPGFEQAGDFH